MTRKRFIKLLMSQGKPRNEAVQLAQCVTRTGYSYQQAYDELFKPSVWDSIMDLFRTVVDALVIGLNQIVIDIQSSIQAVFEER